MSMLIVSRMLLTLYDMVYCDVHVDCVQDVAYIVRHVHCGVHVDCVQDVTYIVRHVHCGVHVDCVQDLTYIVRHGPLRCPC